MIYMESKLNNEILETKWNSSLFLQWANNLYNLIRQSKEILDQSEQNNELYIVKFNIYNTISDENLSTINWNYGLYNGKDVTISTIPYIGVYMDNNTKYFDLFLHWKIIYLIDDFISNLLDTFSQEELNNINSKVTISFNIDLNKGKFNFGYNS